MLFRVFQIEVPILIFAQINQVQSKQISGRSVGMNRKSPANLDRRFSKFARGNRKTTDEKSYFTINSIEYFDHALHPELVTAVLDVSKVPLFSYPLGRQNNGAVPVARTSLFLSFLFRHAFHFLSEAN